MFSYASLVFFVGLYPTLARGEIRVKSQRRLMGFSWHLLTSYKHVHAVCRPFLVKNFFSLFSHFFQIFSHRCIQMFPHVSNTVAAYSPNFCFGRAPLVSHYLPPPQDLLPIHILAENRTLMITETNVLPHSNTFPCCCKS